MERTCLRAPPRQPRCQETRMSKSLRPRYFRCLRAARFPRIASKCGDGVSRRRNTPVRGRRSGLPDARPRSRQRPAREDSKKSPRCRAPCAGTTRTPSGVLRSGERMAFGLPLRQCDRVPYPVAGPHRHSRAQRRDPSADSNEKALPWRRFRPSIQVRRTPGGPLKERLNVELRDGVCTTHTTPVADPQQSERFGTRVESSGRRTVSGGNPAN